ncbi:MAG TPA: response regulator transcription factor, partial [Actinomycetota bacterium]|nr:response regulator transcription factor [Actinomycetota bacterium]
STVLVASGDRLFAESARRYLEERGWRVVATAMDGLQALAALGRFEPSAVLILGQLPRLAPAALARQVRRRWPALPVVLVGGNPPPDATVVPADADGEAVIGALSSPPPATAEAPPERPTSVALLRSLTSRERVVLKQLAEGASLADVARRLEVSQHTVRTHMQNLYAKLGAHSRLDVVRFAAQHGLVGDEEEETG